MNKKSPNFALENNEDPIGALAFTDFSKPSPVLSGEDAERFIRNMEEIERKVRETPKQPKTRAEIENEISVKKMLYEFQERELEKLKEEIKKLEELHAKTKED